MLQTILCVVLGNLAVELYMELGKAIFKYDNHKK